MTQPAAIDNAIAVTENEYFDEFEIVWDDNDFIHLPIKLETDDAGNIPDDEYLDDVVFLCSDDEPFVPIQVKSEMPYEINNGTNQVIAEQLEPESPEPMAAIKPVVQNNCAAQIQPVLSIQSANEGNNIDAFSGQMLFEVGFVYRMIASVFFYLNN